MRIAILFDNFGPYHHARLAAAASACELLAIEFGSRSGEYAWAAQGSQTLRHEVINPDGPGAELTAKNFRERLDRVLTDFNPSVVVVPGWSNRGSFMAITWALKHQIPIVLMSESTAWDEARMGWKEWIKKRIVGLASAALVGGHPHADYMRQLGMAEQQVFLGYDAVDNNYFATEAEKWREEACQLSVVGCRKYFLSSNRFIEKKNLFRLLDAYASYSSISQETGDRGQQSRASDNEPLEKWQSRNGLDGAQRSQTTDHGQQNTDIWPLVLLGDGELRPALIAQCHALGLPVIEKAPWEYSPPITNNQSPITFPHHGVVWMPGFRQIDELPRFYAYAGAFVHASTTEQWGLVVNEAMASSLPVIVSNRVGCAQDLVQDGINGFTFDPLDAEQLVQLMLKISNAEFPIAAHGDASRRIISDWGPDRFATGLKTACEKARETLEKKAGMVDCVILETLIHLK